MAVYDKLTSGFVMAVLCFQLDNIWNVKKKSQSVMIYLWWSFLYWTIWGEKMQPKYESFKVERSILTLDLTSSSVGLYKGHGKWCVCSLPACLASLVGKIISSLALEPTVFKICHILKTTWDIQPQGLKNLGFEL